MASSHRFWPSFAEIRRARTTAINVWCPMRMLVFAVLIRCGETLSGIHELSLSVQSLWSKGNYCDTVLFSFCDTDRFHQKWRVRAGQGGRMRVDYCSNSDCDKRYNWSFLFLAYFPGKNPVEERVLSVWGSHSLIRRGTIISSSSLNISCSIQVEPYVIVCVCGYIYDLFGCSTPLLRHYNYHIQKRCWRYDSYR